MKTTLNKQKSDIKRLSRDNDSLRREISRVTGIRKFTDDVSRNNAMARTESEAQTKLAEFRETVTNIASSLIEALDYSSAQEPDSDRVSSSVPQDNFQSNSMAKTYTQAVLSRSPRVACATTDQHFAGAHKTASRQRPSTTAPISNTPPSNPSQLGQPIPVVTLGARRQQAAAPAQADVDRGDVINTPQRHPSHHRPSSGCGTAVIGTSLVNGLGQRMHRRGISATTFHVHVSWCYGPSSTKPSEAHSELA